MFGGKFEIKKVVLRDLLFTQSLVSSLHTVAQGVSITGQTGSKSALEKNAGVFLNPDQPLVQVSYYPNLSVAYCNYNILCCVLTVCTGSCDIRERHSQTRGKSSVCPHETTRSSSVIVIFLARLWGDMYYQTRKDSHEIKPKISVILLP